MRSQLYVSLKMTLMLAGLCLMAYPALIWVCAQAVPGQGNGEIIRSHGRIVGIKQVGQAFRDDRYFQGRPSAVQYNAAGSGASNLGPSNPELLIAVIARRDSFLAHNPGILPAEIPADLVTASGSGLDPDISVQAALIQIPRISRIRGISPLRLKQLVHARIHGPLAGILGPKTINVLELNLALDHLKE